MSPVSSSQRSLFCLLSRWPVVPAAFEGELVGLALETKNTSRMASGGASGEVRGGRGGAGPSPVALLSIGTNYLPRVKTSGSETWIVSEGSASYLPVTSVSAPAKGSKRNRMTSRNAFLSLRAPTGIRSGTRAVDRWSPQPAVPLGGHDFRINVPGGQRDR